MTLLRLATDAHLIGLATEVYETRRSSFTRPLVARSMCIHRTATLDEHCPSFGDAFVRDLFKFFDGHSRCSTTSRYAELRAQLAHLAQRLAMAPAQRLRRLGLAGGVPQRLTASTPS